MKSLLLASAIVLTLFQPVKASVLIDWGSVPENRRQLEPTTPHPGVNGTYTTGTDFSNARVTVQGSDFAKQSDGLHRPKIDANGPYPAPVLSTVADFRPAVAGTNATVEFTLDFFGFKQGVRDVSFTLFNVENDHGQGRGGVPKRLDDVVTFRTEGLNLTPGADNKVTGNTVTGIADTGPASWGGPEAEVQVHSGNLPLRQIVFDWTEKIEPGNKDFQEELAIGNVIFTPVPEYGQLGIGLAACLLGGLWLYNRRKLSA
jgi:hypothetical protein